MTRITTVLICLLYLCVPAYAQQAPTEYRGQVRGMTGWSAFGDNSFINHAVAGAAADVRLVAGLRAGVEMLYHIGPDQDRDLTITPIVSYDFRRLKRVTPFVGGGAGLLRHTDGFRWGSAPAFGVGGGVKISISERLFVAPEVRIGWEPAMRVMISLGYRF